MAGLVLAAVDGCRPPAVEDTATGLRLFFVASADRDAAAATLASSLPACVATPVDVPDERWAERSQASLSAITVGAITVAPPWDLPEDRSGVIIIEPSMGFGTGHHASTRLCLRLLQEVTVSGSRVLDAGTGSGVLAIAAWQLGAACVVAVELAEVKGLQHCGVGAGAHDERVARTALPHELVREVLEDQSDHDRELRLGMTGAGRHPGIQRAEEGTDVLQRTSDELETSQTFT